MANKIKNISIYLVVGLQALIAIYVVWLYSNTNLLGFAIFVPGMLNYLVGFSIILLVIGLVIRSRTLVYSEVVYLTLIAAMHILYFT